MTNSTAEARLRGVHQRLTEELRHLEAWAEGGGLQDQIEVGSILRELDDAFAGALDKIKERLREQAVRQQGGHTGICVLGGSDLGEATVNIPEASLRVTRGHPMGELRRALGEKFGSFFEEVTTYRPRKDFEAQLLSCQEETQHLLLAAVERVEPTPRVSFRRREANKLEHDSSS